MKKVLATLVLMVGLIFANEASAQEILKQEVHGRTLEESVVALEKKIASKGSTVFNKIDQQAGAKEGGMTINPAVVVVFGNPKVGTQLMNVNMAWTYELPHSIVVYEDNDGKIWLHTRTLPSDIETPGKEKVIESINALIKDIMSPPKGQT